jgi:hypothetical protein
LQKVGTSILNMLRAGGERECVGERGVGGVEKVAH